MDDRSVCTHCDAFDGRAAVALLLNFSRLGVATFRRLTDTMFRNVLVALMVVSAFSILAREFLV